ncbi:MAG: putative neutral zinc metallopeptidase [Firmicutes bacterium ADurb.Bin300]|nr:MAG: putative neutral zinc metallopeptidase [Firmicutes bacterium ADurb.Bin300]HOD02561.1 zinc metallopeptidase [Clostridiales bacterium]
MPYFYFLQDNYYIIFVIIPLIASLIIQAKLKMTYRKYSSIDNSRRMTGFMAAQAVLGQHRISDVSIQGANGRLSDHFDPRDSTIRLSPEVYAGTSIAAISIACHEAGHAVQHKEGYTPIKLRNAILPVTNIGSSLSLPLILLGLFFSIEPFVLAGIIFFSFVVIFHLVTLPVEFNASKRAIEAIDSYNMLTDDEAKGAKKVLNAAALTYIAAFAVSLAQLLRLMLLFRGRRR